VGIQEKGGSLNGRAARRGTKSDIMEGGNMHYAKGYNALSGRQSVEWGAGERRRFSQPGSRTTLRATRHWGMEPQDRKR